MSDGFKKTSQRGLENFVDKNLGEWQYQKRVFHTDLLLMNFDKSTLYPTAISDDESI